MTWLKRNGAAFLVIAIALAAYAFLVVEPRRERDIDSKQPGIVVHPGDSATINGIEWRLRRVDPPPPGKYDAPVPEGTKAVVFVLDRLKAGRPLSADDVKKTFCEIAIVDKNDRRWTKQSHTALISIQDSLKRMGYRAFCAEPGPFMVVGLVPPDASDLSLEVTIRMPKSDVTEVVRFESPPD
ncbi:hypothetical protein [Mycobacterium sp. NPDC050853]|uniref:hypothetical protein n=1 Tax=Mycobacteriaceae TaxID=1762 RepID=UPI0015DE3052|nr:hypothetical protein [Mycobacteroides sp. LB1]